MHKVMTDPKMFPFSKMCCPALLAAMFCVLAGLAPAAFPTLYMKPVCLQQLHSPTNMTTANDGSGRIFICEQQGKVMIFQGGMLRPTPFLDLSGSFVTLRGTPAGASYDERGLLGMAFHPGYSNSSSPGYRKFYVYYMKDSPNAPGTASAPVDSMSVISEFQVSATDPNVAVLASERVLLSFDQPQFNHSGGQLEFGPDGYLYIGFGDGGSANDNNAGHTGGNATSPRPNGILGNGQDRRVLFGKIIRIDPLGTDGPGGQYGIPADNPFVGMGQDFADNSLDGPMRGEIWSYGMRNPWRFCFDKRAGGTNRMFCGDVGQGKVEEINLIVGGGNYGWRYKEGSFVFDSLMATNGIAPASPIDPIAQYEHPGLGGGTLGLPSLGLSVTGGYVYRGSAIPALVGKYVFGDYGATSGTASGRLMGLEETSPGVFALTQTLPLVGPNPFALRVQCLGEDESGELYVGTKITAGVLELSGGLPAGGIYKLVPAATTGTVNITNSNSSSTTAGRDTTIFSESDFSDATGSYMFAGVAGGQGTRRAMLSFSVTSTTIPAGASVAAARVTLQMTKQAQTGAISNTFTLHKMNAQWLEGTSNSDGQSPGPGFGIQATVNDATWNFRKITSVGPPLAGTAWTSPGADGDYVDAISGSVFITTTGAWQFTGAGLAADVQSWVTTPSTNFGWILRGDESYDDTNALNKAAKQFASRQYGTSSQRPKLAIDWGTPPAATRRETWLSTYFPTQPIGFYLGDDDDAEGDGIDNLIEYAYAFSPLAKNASDGLTASSTSNGSGTDHNFTFRRDPRATDLTYELQVSTDMVGWTTIVTSTAGATPTGAGFVSEADAVGEAPVKVVTARQVLAAGADTRDFVRLKITRAP